MKKITLLGSTGSIGKNTLDVLSRHPDRFEIVALTAKSRVNELFQQCLQFKPKYAVVAQQSQAMILQSMLKSASVTTEVLSGSAALEEVARLPEVDYVMAGIVGAAGLLPTLAAAEAGKRILLANKEALVMGGALILETINQSGATLLPVDSEHNALFQCMPPDYISGNRPAHVDKIILTASGGPFRSWPYHQFKSITPEQAIAHPNWNMGHKISVDSATLMNKGLEVIEAFWLFNLPLEKIEVLVHPESIIHSLVCYRDGSLLAQLGEPDMRTPIACTLSWPERMEAGVKSLDLKEIGKLTFESVDYDRFPCLHLAYEALKKGGTATVILNAANEVAVEEFLQRRIKFTEIPCVIEETLNSCEVRAGKTIEEILEADRQARHIALARILCT